LGIGGEYNARRVGTKAFHIGVCQKACQTNKDKLITSSPFGLNGIAGLNNTMRRKKEALISQKKNKKKTKSVNTLEDEIQRERDIQQQELDL